MSAFARNLQSGKAGESAIAEWLKGRGWNVMPVYEKIIDEGKGPQVFSADRELVAPDLFVFNGQKCLWVEAKHKTGFTWHRLTKKWETGIDRRHYLDYLEVRKRSGIPLYLMFLHKGGQAKDSPPSPAGLFSAEILHLSENINHTDYRWGRSGMVYWAIETLNMTNISPIPAPPQSRRFAFPPCPQPRQRCLA